MPIIRLPWIYNEMAAFSQSDWNMISCTESVTENTEIGLLIHPVRYWLYYAKTKRKDRYAQRQVYIIYEAMPIELSGTYVYYLIKS